MRLLLGVVAMVAAAAVVLRSRQRAEVWHSLPESAVGQTPA